MGYVAVQGGQEAIAHSNKLWRLSQVESGHSIDVQAITGSMGPLVEQVMSEASLYDEELAALAIKQAGGSMEEAVFLLRAHRSTLPRKYYSTITDTKDMFVERRISSSFKDIPGGQLLGSSNDFAQRFLNFDLYEEDNEKAKETAERLEELIENNDAEMMALDNLPKVRDYLQKVGLLKEYSESNETPDDITKESIQFPSSRSQKLQSLTRGQTGAVTALGYAEIRSFGISNHPNIGELRVGQLPIHVSATGDGMKETDEDDYYIGSVRLTEVESFFSLEEEDEGESTQEIGVGYGAVFGQNETKAIAMSVLDYALSHGNPEFPTSDDEFVLLHIDSVESSGFISHLKLPHYVTFQSKLDSIRQIDNNKREEQVELNEN